MQGFTNKALLVMPKVETYDSRNLEWQIKLLDSVRNMCSYLRSVGIEPHCIFTDELSHTLPLDVKWVSPVSAGDIFFIKNNVDGFVDVKDPIYPDCINQINEIAKKFATPRGLAIEERFNILLKREVRGVAKLMEEYRVIVAFQHPNNPAFKLPESKEGDGKLIIQVNHVSFLASATLGGTQLPINSILQREDTLLPLFKWEV